MTPVEIEAKVRAELALREVAERIQAAAVAAGATLTEIHYGDDSGTWLGVRWPDGISQVAFWLGSGSFILNPKVQDGEPERLLSEAKRCLDILPALQRAHAEASP